LKKSATKFFLRENRQRQSFKAFIVLSIGVELVGTSLSTRKFGRTHPLAKRRFSIYFRS